MIDSGSTETTFWVPPLLEFAPFFVVGSSRSGTTMLRLILAGHSRITIPPETWFILPLVNTFPLTEPLSRKQTAEAVQTIVECHRWPDMSIGNEGFLSLAGSIQHPRLRDLIDLVYRVHLDRNRKARVGEKTPTYVNIIPQIKTIYPEAKFIHLIRDGRDVAISFVEANFKGRYYHGSDFEWTKAIRAGMAYRHSKFADDILEVRYEELVQAPETTVREVCRFLGECFESDMMNFQQRIGIVPQRERGIHTKLVKQISLDCIGTWRRLLSGPECFVIEAALRAELVKLGYNLRFKSLLWWPLAQVTRLIMRCLASLLDRVLPALRRRGMLTKHRYL